MQTSQRLENLEELNKVPKVMPAALCNRVTDMKEKVRSLHEMGSTALGPALYLSVAIASQVQGSSVVICTDGCANEGLGQLEAGRGHRAGLLGPEFYPFLGEHAKKLGVIVNILSFKGATLTLTHILSFSIYLFTHFNYYYYYYLIFEFIRFFSFYCFLSSALLLGHYLVNLTLQFNSRDMPWFQFFL